MNIIIFSAIALGIISIVIALSLKARKKRVDNVLAKHGLLKHKIRQEQRAQESASNQALFAE